MTSEQQYIDLYRECREQICAHSADVLNAVRDEAFNSFERLGFPSRKVERYKYTTIDKLFEPNYGLNINRLEVRRLTPSLWLSTTHVWRRATKTP